MMTTKHCEALGCHDTATGFSTLCNRHKQTMRRHGHPLQTGITAHELRPYLARIKARQERNKGSELWSILEARWKALEGHGKSIMEAVMGGAAHIRHERLAAQQIGILAGSVPADKAIQTALAMYLMADERPTRFQSDKAFRFELVRRMRGLSEVNAASYWDHKAGKMRKVYRDTPPDAMETLGRWIAEAFGAAGLTLAGKEREEAQLKATERQRLADALERLE